MELVQAAAMATDSTAFRIVACIVVLLVETGRFNYRYDADIRSDAVRDE
jgi:hypothetical protein